MGNDFIEIIGRVVVSFRNRPRLYSFFYEYNNAVRLLYVLKNGQIVIYSSHYTFYNQKETIIMYRINNKLALNVLREYIKIQTTPINNPFGIESYLPPPYIMRAYKYACKSAVTKNPFFTISPRL